MGLMTTAVSIARAIPLARSAIVPILRAKLELLEEASEHGSVVLSAQIPGNGRVAVPVRVRVRYPAPKTPGFGLAIAALTTPSLYPRFRGDIDLTKASPAATELRLSGEYHVPLGILGRAFEAVVAPNVAPRGLEDLLDRLVADVTAEVSSRSDAAYRAGRRSE
jgi:hypothetical protein